MTNEIGCDDNDDNNVSDTDTDTDTDDDDDSTRDGIRQRTVTILTIL